MREATSIGHNAAITTGNGMPTEAEFERLLDQIFAEPSAFPWSTERDTGAFLGSLVRLLRPARVLELGTFKGATTIQLIRALPFAGEPRVVTVDCLDGRSPALRKLDAFYSFVPGQDIDLVPDLDGSFDFVYLDTLHNYEHTKAQVAVVRAHHPSAVIAVHDILSHAGVSQALAEFASEYEVLSLPTPPQPDGRVNGLAILSPKHRPEPHRSRPETAVNAKAPRC
jgi:predicted O-methyltransferase YrrM